MTGANVYFMNHILDDNRRQFFFCIILFCLWCRGVIQLNILFVLLNFNGIIEIKYYKLLGKNNEN